MRNKTFRSGIAVMVASMLLQILMVVKVIILARILDPSDFGLISLTSALMVLSTLVSGMGMGPALIATKQEPSRAAFHALLITTWTSSILTFLILVFAPVYAELFDTNELTEICRWMAIIIPLSAITVVADAILVKEMMFGRRIIPSTAGSLSNAVTAVIMAYSGFGVWSIVVGHIVGSFVTLMATLIVCPTLRWFMPQKWDGLLARDMSRFGLTNLGTGLVQCGYEYGDKMVVGKVFGMTDLGFYSQAFHLSNITVGRISSSANAVLFPAYAKIQEDTERLAQAFLNSLRLVSVVTMPLAMGMLLLAPELVIVVIGEKWRESIPLLQIFAFIGFIRPVTGSASPLFLAINQPQYNLKGALILGISMAILLLAVIQWNLAGVAGVALAWVGAYGVAGIYNLYIIHWRSGLPIRLLDFFLQLFPALIGTLIMMGTLVWLKQPMLYIVGGTHNILSLSGLVFAGMLIYGLTLFMIKPSLVLEIIELILSGIGLRGKSSRSVATETL